jgi:hypothetical protein
MLLTATMLRTADRQRLLFFSDPGEKPWGRASQAMAL